MKQEFTRFIDSDYQSEEIYHIPGIHNMQQTLCGWVDVPYEQHHYSEHPVNCRQCIDAYKEIKALKFPKCYFEE